jgi:hypothetical protein
METRQYWELDYPDKVITVLAFDICMLILHSITLKVEQKLR